MEWWRRLPTNTKLVVGVGGAAALFLLYRYIKGKQAAASSSSSTSGGAVLQPTGTTASTSPQTPPTVSVSVPGGGTYSGPPGSLGTVLPILSPPPASTGALPEPNPTALQGQSPSTVPTAPNLPPVVTIGGQQYYVLGQVGPAAPGGGYTYSGYNVGGGSQVFYGNQNAIAQGSPQPGAFAYTPVGNAGLVSSSTSSGEVIH